MKKMLFAALILLISAQASADWFKQVVQPDVAGRDVNNACVFDGPVYVKIKVDAGQKVTWWFTDSNGITFPLSFATEFSESFKGMLPVNLPPGYEIIGYGGYFLVDFLLSDSSGQNFDHVGPIKSFVCPYL